AQLQRPLGLPKGAASQAPGAHGVRIGGRGALLGPDGPFPPTSRAATLPPGRKPRRGTPRTANRMTPQAAPSLIPTGRAPSSTDAAWRAAGQHLFDALGRAQRPDADRVLADLAGALDLEDPLRASFLGTICGALVERGCDPSLLAGPLLGRLGPMLESA